MTLRGMRGDYCVTEDFDTSDFDTFDLSQPWRVVLDHYGPPGWVYALSQASLTKYTPPSLEEYVAEQTLLESYEEFDR